MSGNASPRAAVTAYIGLGGNLGDPRAAIGHACDARSHDYRSAPVGVTGQPDYINAVACIETALSPSDLLAAMLRIESDVGRTRDYHMSPRTLDLDLLLYARERIDAPHLHVPHPRMHLRAFVLEPLAELAPDLHIPGAGALADLLPGVSDQSIARLGGN